MTDDVGRLSAALEGRYRIERELGAGGMAVVYLAHDVKHNRKVALKVLRPELAHAIGPERFLREIETTANLRHPHILPLYDSGQIGGQAVRRSAGQKSDGAEAASESLTAQPPDRLAAYLFYVMPFVEGESLRDRLNREKQLPLEDALQIAREVADALSYAHSRGVVHRDIKPENILLESGHAVVADFGIARAVDAAGGTQLTETGLTIGTPTYMSPEQASGEGELDGRSDLYALGCVLYEMLAGQPPFTGPSVESVIHQHLMVEAPPITNLRPAVPPGVAAALQRALAKTPADRFNPVAQFSDTLRVPTPVAAGTRAPAPAPAPTAAPPRRRRVSIPVLATVGAIAALAAIAVIAFGLGRGEAPAAEAHPTSLAVLPFENIGGDPQNEYFSDGITEDIIAKVSQIAGLKVISRTSTMQFKGSTATIRDIGGQLNVTSVLEGSVRRAGNRVRIVAQLIDARTDEHLWANTYDRDLADIFAIQSDVAQNIASALGSVLAAGSGPAVPTENLEAYDRYLRGRLLWNQRTGDALRGAIERFEAAVTLDPHFAEAYAALAESWTLLPVYTQTPGHDALAKVERYADSALALNPRLPGAYAAQGFARAFIGWKFADGEGNLREAIALNPSYATAHQWIASVLDAEGKLDEALDEYRRAEELDPLSSIVATDVAMGLMSAGRYAESQRQFQKVITRDPRFAPAFQRAAWLYGTMGRDSSAVDMLEQWNVLRGRPLVPPGALRTAYAAGGRRAMYQLLVDAGTNGRVGLFDLAFWYVRLGQNAQALDVLEESATRREAFLGAALTYPMWDALKEEPRYRALATRVHGR